MDLLETPHFLAWKFLTFLLDKPKMQSKVNDAISKNVRIECKDPAYAKMLEEELAASDPEKEGQAWANVCALIN